MSTGVRHIERFIRLFPDFTLAVSVGTTERDSLLFIKRINGRINFILFHPNVENHIVYVRHVIDQIRNKNLTRDVAYRLESTRYETVKKASSSDYVWAEISTFLLDNYDPFDISNTRNLCYLEYNRTSKKYEHPSNR